MSDILQGIAGEVAAMGSRVWGVKERLGFVEWCERNIVITSEESADYRGPYRKDLVLSVGRFWEEFLDGGDGERWQKMFATKGSQSAFSAHALMALCRHVEYSPGNVIYAIDTATRAEEISNRFLNFLRNAESLGGIVESCGAHDLTGLSMSLPGMSAWFVGAASVGDMAMKQGVKLIVGDEVDLHATPKNDARTLDLLSDRGKATEAFKLAAFCKPSTPDGQIWAPMIAGSQHRDFVPCPHCGVMQFLKMERLVYAHLTDHHGDPDFGKILHGTEYECEGCGRAIAESRKQEILFEGEVRPTNYVKRTNEDGETETVEGWAPGHMSVRHNDLYALWHGSGWGNLAIEKIQAKKDPMKLKAFVNGRAGDVWKEGSARRVELADILAMSKEGPEYYKGGVVPFEVASIFCLADTQNELWKATIMVFDHAGNAAVMDWGWFIAWEELVEFAKKGAQVSAGVWHPCHICLVDEGGTRTWEVRRRCSGLYPVFHPIKGTGGIQVTHSLKWRDFGLYKDGGEDGEKVQALVYDDPGFKYLLYRTLILGRRRAAPGDPKLYFPRAVAEGFARELCSEHLEKVGGKWRWVVPSGAMNDYGDTVKEGLIAWAEFGAMAERGTFPVPLND